MHARPLLKVHLNRDDATYKPGDAVSGYVHLDAGTDCQADAIEVGFEWMALSETGNLTQRVATKRLDGGTWKKGEHAEFPFAFIVPAGPASFGGRTVSLGWQVTARGSVDWTDDAVATQPLTVVADAATEVDGWDLGPSHRAEPHMPTRPRGALSTFGLVLMGFALLSIVLALGTPSALASATLLLVSVGLAASGVTAMWWAHRNQVASQKTGDVVVNPSPLTAVPGSTLVAELFFPVVTDLKINKVDVTLRGEAVSLETHGEVDRTEQVYDKDARPLDRVELKKEDDVRVRIPFELPADAPYSFAFPHGAVRWELEVHIDIPSWPDFKATWPVEIRPRSPLDQALPPEEGGADTEVETAASPPEPKPEPRLKPLRATGSKEAAVEVARGVDRILKALNPTERDVAIDHLKQDRFRIRMVADQVTWTSALDEDEVMQGGRTVVGQLKGSDAKVAVRFPPAENARLDGMMSGTELELHVQLKDWNPLFARPEFDVQVDATAEAS